MIFQVEFNEPDLCFYPFLCKLGLKMIVKINYLLQFQTIYYAKLFYHTKFYFTATKNTKVTAFPIWEVLDAPYCMSPCKFHDRITSKRLKILGKILYGTLS